MLPHRPPGSPAHSARAAGFANASPASLETLKARIVTKLEDRLDPGASKRMPSSLLRQSLLTAAEHITDQEAKGLPKPERDRLVEQVLAELLGYGPLEELFRDPTVREVMVTGPEAVIVRREGGQWLPTNIKFRDENHVRAALDRLATHADPVGGVTTSVNLFDLKLPNGFRSVGVIPPEAMGVPATVAFVRFDAISSAAIPQPTAAPAAAAPATTPNPQPASGTVGVSARPAPTTVPDSGTVPTASRRPPSGESGSLALHRKRIIERLIAKMASLGVYDVQRVELTELRRVVAAYVTEYCAKENIYLSDSDQGRLQLEILTAMHR
jgi:hypothetical protein